MKLKLDESGHAVVQDGHPVYETDDGETPYNVPQLVEKITALNAENAERRVALKEAQATMKGFKGIDSKAAREALAFRDALGEDFDAKEVTQRIAALEAEKVGLTQQLEETSETLTEKDSTIWNLTVGQGIANFSASEWAKEHLLETYSTERLERLFKDDFQHNGGKLVMQQNGEAVMSRKNPGQPAGVEEALEIVISKDKSMQKASDVSGGGSDPRSNGKGSRNLAGVTKRSDLKSPAEKVAFIKDHGRDKFEALED